MKKLMCLLVVFLISNAANAADKWEYVQFAQIHPVPTDGEKGQTALTYPDGKTDFWGKGLRPSLNTGFSKFFGALPQDLAIRSFGEPINVINALGFLGFEMCGVRVWSNGTHYWFKRKIK